MSPELPVSLLLVPAEPTELPAPDVSELMEPLPIVPEALEPWLAPLDEPMELLPPLDPERLVPAEPDPIVEPELLDEPDEPDDPAELEL